MSANSEIVSLAGNAVFNESPRRRARFPGISKARIIRVSAFLVAGALGLVNLGIIFHARDVLRVSPAIIGWISASWPLGYIFGCLVIGPRLHRFAPRYPVVVSTLGLSICFGSLSLVTSIPLFISICLLYGLTLSLFWPFLMGWMSAGHEGAQLGRETSRYNLAWCAATVISPSLCGVLSEMDTRLPLQTAAVLVLCTGLLLLAAVLVLPRIRSDRTHVFHEARNDDGTRVKRTHLRFAAWLGLAVTFFGMGVIAAVFPVSARQDFGFSMSWVGNLMLIRSLFNVVGFFIMGKTHRWHFRTGPMLAGQILGIMGFTGLMLASRIGWMAVCLGFCGMGGAVSYSYSMFHGVSGSVNRSSAMAVHELLLALGLVSGSAIGGMLYQTAGINVVYGLCIACLSLMLPVQVWIGKWNRDAEAADSVCGE